MKRRKSLRVNSPLDGADAFQSGSPLAQDSIWGVVVARVIKGGGRVKESPGVEEMR